MTIPRFATKKELEEFEARGDTKGQPPSSRTAAKRGVVRGRFDFLCVFPGGGSLRVTSDKTRSLSAAELIAGLREWADRFERAVAAEEKGVEHDA